MIEGKGKCKMSRMLLSCLLLFYCCLLRGDREERDQQIRLFMIGKQLLQLPKKEVKTGCSDELAWKMNP